MKYRYKFIFERIIDCDKAVNFAREKILDHNKIFLRKEYIDVRLDTLVQVDNQTIITLTAERIPYRMEQQDPNGEI